jgi:hypothetical protein
MLLASRNLTLDAQSQQESHVKWTSLCIEPNAKSLKLFNPQTQPKMPSDTAGVTGALTLPPQSLRLPPIAIAVALCRSLIVPTVSASPRSGGSRRPISVVVPF